MSAFYRRILFACIFICIQVSCSIVHSETLSLKLHKVELVEALHSLARFLHMNLLINPNIKGIASLELNNAEPKVVFSLLLQAYGLETVRQGNVLYVTTRYELIKRKEEESHWQRIFQENMTTTTQVIQLKYAKAGDILHLIRSDHFSFLSKRGKIYADNRTNIICINDVPNRLQDIRRIIQKLDVPVQQLVIKARLVSIDYDYERDLGLQFSSKARGRELTTTKSNTSFAFAIAKLADNSLLDVRLAALESAGHANLISSPTLFTGNQQTASIEAGEEVPYQEVSESGGTAVAFKKAVLGLHVTPQVLPDNRVLLQLQINQDRPGNKLIHGMPAISTRQIHSSVLVENGQTFVLGGIYETSDENNQEGLPLISRIPLLGMLLQQHKIRHHKRELVIFVTPLIIK